MCEFRVTIHAGVAILVTFVGSGLWAGTTLLDPWGDPTSVPNVYTTAGADVDNVGALRVEAADGTFGCSATLIADGGWLLTAGHCSDGATGANTTFSLDPQVGNSGSSFFLGSDTHEVVEVVPHPKWDGNLGRGYDIALMRLREIVPLVTPAELYTGSSEIGNVATIVGYGMYGTDVDGVLGTDGYKRAGSNVIDNFFRTGGKSPRLLAVDFDNGTQSAFGTTTPTATELFSVFGDSGGPVFIGDQVAGVNSFLSDANGDGKFGTAGDYSGHTRVSVFADWITDVAGGVAGGGGGEEPDDGGGPPPGRGRGRFSFVEPIAMKAVASVPEPGSLWLAICGGSMMVFCRRRRPANAGMNSWKHGRTAECLASTFSAS